jgi:hypothetical protein
VILDADPLADVHNIPKVRSLMQGGTVVDLTKLPENHVLSTKPTVAAEGAAEKAKQ